MGTILWGESPLYIIWKVSYMITLKSTSRWQLRLCEELLERSLSANLRAYALKLYQAEPQDESAQHDEVQPDHCEMVNTEVVQRQITAPALSAFPPSMAVNDRVLIRGDLPA